MKIKSYNHKEFTEKDLFECKLKDVRPDFGYISISMRNDFYAFCIQMGFLEFTGTGAGKKMYAYKVLEIFRNSRLQNNRVKPYDCDIGEYLIVDRNRKLLSTHRRSPEFENPASCATSKT